MIYVESRRKKIATLEKLYSEASIVDVTSKADVPMVRFSPFYPHGHIPVPFSPGVTGESVEGVWQGLKVFESEDVDVGRFRITAMKGLKRTVRKYGRVLGHRRGVNGKELLDYGSARREIYLPLYRWVLEQKLRGELKALKQLLDKGPLVLLDYETNTDLADLSRPLSHAGLIRSWLEDIWPN